MDQVITMMYDNCPHEWIGIGNKCYFFSTVASNWTYGQAFCKKNESDLVHFDNQLELVRKKALSYIVSFHDE